MKIPDVDPIAEFLGIALCIGIVLSLIYTVVK
jgi:hypothetical protein